MDAGDRAGIAGVLEAADGAVWESALRTLVHHGMLPLIAHRLREESLESLAPPHLLAGLRKSHRNTLLRNQRYASCLAGVVALLREQGIEPMLWKGIVVMDRAWPDEGARIVGDLDLFIEPDEMAAAAETLVGAGFCELQNSAKAPARMSIRKASALICSTRETAMENGPPTLLY